MRTTLSGGEEPPAHAAAARHPLAFLARHYAIQAAGFLNSLDGPGFEPSPFGSALEVVSWYHTLIPLKTSHALGVAAQAKADAPELMTDAVVSATVVLVAIDRSLAAWQALANGDQTARIGGLIELLEALRTAVELRFPDARVSPPADLDDDDAAGEKVSARAIGSGGSDDGCAGEHREPAGDSPRPAPRRAGASARGSSP